MATATTPPPSQTPQDRLDRWFEVSARGSTYRTEVIGGVTTFLTLVYIVFVNPAILSGTADLHGVKLAFDQLLAVTALAGGILTILMGVFGKYPFALASGLGLNAFAAAEVAAHRVTWASMMGIFVIDGAVIIVLVVLGLRERIIDAIPYDLKLAIGIGIGGFITIVGLKNAGFIVQGGELGTLAAHLGTWKILVFTVALLLTFVLYQRGTRGALLFGILGATVLATVINAIDGYHIWTDGTARLPQGSWLTTPDLSLADGSHVGFSFGVLGVGGAIAVILAVVMSDLFDNVGTSISVGRNAGMLDDQGRLPRIRTALGIDGLAALLGGFMSASSNTTFIESNAGVAAGARTGLASVVTGVLLLLCMFISPIAGIIPTEATAAALVIVGVMMFSLVRDLRWDNASPLAVFATIIVMPVTYSIANGVGVGIILHTATEVLSRRRVSPLLIVFSGFFIWYFLHGTV
ncbi:MAG TPA: NCS2 family permease [Solirubrobacteraceae bacterium]|nr:NCS2 family permease [Solirubrobacteraceae bacterium]